MNIVQLYESIKQYALTIPIVQSYYNTSVYECWNNQNVKYGSVVFAVKSVRETNSIAKYDCVIYYGDRLNDNKSNRDAIQSDAIGVINTIVNQLNCSDNIEFVTYPVQSTIFEQRFADELAGAYANITIDLQSNGDCCINPFDNYYTKEQVDELIANTTISYAVFDYNENDVVNLVAGDISKVIEDYKQHKPIMIFAPVDNHGKMGIVNCLQLLLMENGYDNDYLIGYVNYFDGDSITYRRYSFNHFGTTGYSNATKSFLDYYTRRQVDELIANNKSISYAIYDYGYFDDKLYLVAGDITKVFEDFKQHKPVLIFAPFDDSGKLGLVNCIEIDSKEDGYEEDCVVGCVNYFNGDSIIFRRYLFALSGGIGHTTLTKSFLNYYTKEQVDELVANVDVDMSNYYTKTDIDALVGDINEVLDSLINDVDTSALEARLNSILNDK